MTKSVYPDQTSHSAVSDLDLYCSLFKAHSLIFLEFIYNEV